MSYVKSIDSLRAFAVLAVVFDHWALVFDHGQYVPTFLHSIPFGTIGVTVFFVLSGYLISGILMDSKKAIDQNKISLKRAFSVFYIRRTLRIFPIYYLLLIILLLFTPYLFEFDKNSQYWFFGYMTNFYLYFRSDWIGDFMPLWSLGVEEQFYLFWPFVLLLINRKYTVYAIIALISLGLFSRVYFEFFSPELLRRGGFYIFTTPTCLDSFGLGALLAYFIKNNLLTDYSRKIIFYLSILAIIVLATLIVFLKFPTPSQNILYRFLISIISIHLINLLIAKNWVSKLFENNVTVYLGKISYSMYLFHNFLPNIYQKLSTYFLEINLKIPFTNYSILPYIGGNIQLIIYLFVLIFLSSISWFLFEKPINSLKNKFTY
jgi:peptidoglycan/LPS O-acetylase OafA/YrhL